MAGTISFEPISTDKTRFFVVDTGGIADQTPYNGAIAPSTTSTEMYTGEGTTTAGVTDFRSYEIYIDDATIGSDGVDSLAKITTDSNQANNDTDYDIYVSQEPVNGEDLSDTDALIFARTGTTGTKYFRIVFVAEDQ